MENEKKGNLMWKENAEKNQKLSYKIYLSKF